MRDVYYDSDKKVNITSSQYSQKPKINAGTISEYLTFWHFSGKLLPSINKDHLKMFFFSLSYAYCSVLKKINCITILVKGPLRGQEQEVEVNTKMNRQTNSDST